MSISNSVLYKTWLFVVIVIGVLEEFSSEASAGLEEHLLFFSDRFYIISVSGHVSLSSLSHKNAQLLSLFYMNDLADLNIERQEKTMLYL